MLKLPSLSKVLRRRKRIRKSLPTLGQKQRKVQMPDIGTDAPPPPLLVDDTLQRLANALDDMALAKRVIKLKEQYPNGTMPELVAIEWLERRGKRWAFQVWVLGGRKQQGGQVLDLIVDNGNAIIVLEIQGNYWHNRPGQKAVDEAQRLVLMGITIWDKPVIAVVEAWENRIMDKRKRDAVMEAALLGIGLGE